MNTGEFGMFLWFTSPNAGRKWYAETPSGELAFSDTQGLYEWRDGQRIAYTGADRQAADSNGKWTLHGRPEPNQRGILYAVRQYTQGVN